MIIVRESLRPKPPNRAAWKWITKGIRPFVPLVEHFLCLRLPCNEKCSQRVQAHKQHKCAWLKDVPSVIARCSLHNHYPLSSMHRGSFY